MSQDGFGCLPNELVEKVFGYLTVDDLCHVTLCGRSWRESANQDALWRPFCRWKGWEHYGTMSDLCKEVPLKPNSPEQKTGEGGAPTFPVDAVVTGSDWPGLVDTCKWKEVYMKARHLEGNWRNNRYHVSSFEFGSAGYREWLFEYIGPGPEPLVCNMAGEGDCLAVGISIGTMQIWDVSNCKRRHLIQVNVSEAPDALKMKDGIIAAGCKDGKIRTFSAQTGEQLQVMSGHRLPVLRLFFDGNTIVSTAYKEYRKNEVYADSDIRVWSAADGCCRYNLQSGSVGRRLDDLDYKDKIVAGAYNDKTIRVWNADSGSRIQQFTVQARDLLSCHLGDGIVIGAYDGNVVMVWSLESGDCIKTFDVPGNYSEKYGKLLDRARSYTFNGALLLSTSCNNHMRLLDLNGKFLGDSRPYSNEFNFEPIVFRGNKLVAADLSGGANHLWSVDQDGFHYIKEVRRIMFDDEVTVRYSVAWMSETKLAFVTYVDFESFEQGITEQIPIIIVHHYW
ncbi:F-box/WD repeat-containing protein 7-like [Patiria miniata]|uniref:F-box domain-containing protein n=1 Tax=Patiria miniata TaxID=46514 RepID=A0A914A7T2_PATMI|nr:F-box/WD repeat-containing protein 7-like [Patiria miniata]